MKTLSERFKRHGNCYSIRALHKKTERRFIHRLGWVRLAFERSVIQHGGYSSHKLYSE